MKENISRFAAATQKIGDEVYVAPGAVLVGAVELGDGASVWFQSVLRADLNSIRIGSRSNVQDGAILHVADEFGVEVGSHVTIGHGAVLHACRVEGEVLIGMKAVVLDGAVVGPRSIVGANALVTGGIEIPAGSLVLGSPAKVVRALSVKEQDGLAVWAERYVELAKAYREGIPNIRRIADLPPLPLH
jgi:carbonic anhydrase/acetyltransferase-like protein (isoleucine patch superfamily)